ncbi:MAG: DUF4956 domain-containing protein [Clostridiales bacterium]|nr:DUF4956 domain-containing protein [Clostridiales bacterium]
MSVQDVIKKSFLESGAFSSINVTNAIVVLLLSLIGGLFIFAVYSRFFNGVIYSKNFGMTLVGMTVLTCMVTQAISTNVVISLGMVGALSIVRYRTAVKDPLDLLYLFWGITTGITIGANMYVLALAAAIVMFLLVILFSGQNKSKRIYVMIARYDEDAAGDEIIRALGRMKYCVKSKTLRGSKTEMAVELFCRTNDNAFLEKIRAIKGVNDVTLIQYNGEYHG